MKVKDSDKDSLRREEGREKNREKSERKEREKYTVRERYKEGLVSGGIDERKMDLGGRIRGKLIGRET